MATKNNTYKSYSMEYGTFLGLGWGATFLCYVEGVSTDNALLILLCFILCAACLVMPFFFAMRLNRKLYAIDERLSYPQGLSFAFSMFMYACLMSGLIHFVYFKWLDDGMLYEQLNSIMTQANMVEAYRQMGMAEQYAQIKDMIRQVNDLSEWEKTLGLFNKNFFFSIIMSFVVAVVASYGLKGARSKK